MRLARQPAAGEGFLIGQFRNEPEGGTNVGGGEIVLALKLFKGHTAGQAART
jgi:hypothetical protein